LVQDLERRENLTNRVDQLAKLFKYNWSIRSLFEISEQFLASWTQGLRNSKKENF